MEALSILLMILVFAVFVIREVAWHVLPQRHWLNYRSKGTSDSGTSFGDGGGGCDGGGGD